MNLLYCSISYNNYVFLNNIFKRKHRQSLNIQKNIVAGFSEIDNDFLYLKKYKILLIAILGEMEISPA